MADLNKNTRGFKGLIIHVVLFFVWTFQFCYPFMWANREGMTFFSPSFPIDRLRCSGNNIILKRIVKPRKRDAYEVFVCINVIYLVLRYQCLL